MVKAAPAGTRKHSEKSY